MKPVLIIQHAPLEHPAVMLRALQAQNIPTLWIHPYQGDSLPTAKDIAGVISLGGPMSANDDKIYPWLSRERNLLLKCITAKKPVVGICLGAQVLAQALGAKVARHSTVELGWHLVKLNSAGRKDAVLGPAGPTALVYHWHEETFELPPGATLLGSSPHCRTQAFRMGDRIYGFQFHPEADHQLVLEWLECPGVRQEIAAYQASFGKKSVQDTETQRGIALQGEKASLKITAGIASCFLQESNQPGPFGREDIERFQLNRVSLQLELRPAENLILRGLIVAIIDISAGEFLILQDMAGLLWPIRLADIQDVKLIS